MSDSDITFSKNVSNVLLNKYLLLWVQKIRLFNDILNTFILTFVLALEIFLSHT